jgi:hypothetical protein
MWSDIARDFGKKQGAAGITTAAPYVTGLWGRGMTGCRDDAEAPGSVPARLTIILPFCKNYFVHG